MARAATVNRETKETQVRVELDLDGTGVRSLDTPLPFFTHMLDAFESPGFGPIGEVDEGRVIFRRWLRNVPPPLLPDAPAEPPDALAASCPKGTPCALQFTQPKSASSRCS